MKITQLSCAKKKPPNRTTVVRVVMAWSEEERLICKKCTVVWGNFGRAGNFGHLVHFAKVISYHSFHQK